jgi:hypothetical protein
MKLTKNKIAIMTLSKFDKKQRFTMDEVITYIEELRDKYKFDYKTEVIYRRFKWFWKISHLF